jgi:hypothetical protein
MRSRRRRGDEVEEEILCRGREDEEAMRSRRRRGRGDEEVEETKRSRRRRGRGDEEVKGKF